MIGTWQNGHVVLDGPAGWPEGCRLKIEPMSRESTLGLREEDWPVDPAGITALLARMDEVEPLEISPEEEESLAVWRQKIKEYTLAHMEKGVEDQVQ